jgi:hypothetical protein
MYILSLQCKKLAAFSRTLGITLISTAILYAVTGLAPVYSGGYDFTAVNPPTPADPAKFCMADAYLMKDGNSLSQDALNCTANDVEITNVDPKDTTECTLGEVFTFEGDVTVRTNAKERYDTTFYMPLTTLSPQIVHGPGLRDCSMLLPIPGDSSEAADVDIDSDECGDIAKNGSDEYVLVDEPITMLCADNDANNQADFTYCAAWDNIERLNCTAGEDPYAGQIPGTKSKCNCDTFNIDIFIRPTPPVVNKTLVSTNTYPEPGGEYTFNISFTNPSTASSLFLTALTDEIDSEAASDNLSDAYDTSLDLWGSLDTVLPNTDGIYLTATNCTQPPDLGNGPGEILKSGTYSCQIKVHIVDSDLPDDQSPELYDDVIKAVLEDKNGNAVGDGLTCPGSLSAGSGENCSSEVRVQVTNISPTIAVLKSVVPDSITETTSGTQVTYTVRVTNTSPFDAVTITEIKDAFDGDPAGNVSDPGNCEVDTELAKDAYCEFSYQRTLTGDTGDTISNTVTAKAVDNEADEADNFDVAAVTFTNSPGAIKLLKTPSPTHVTESGDDVVFTFVIENTSVVDHLTLTEMTDDIFGLLFDDTSFRDDDGLLVACDFYGDVLAPGDKRTCSISEFLSGEPGAENGHVNTATVIANTGDTITCPPDGTHPEPYPCLEEVWDVDPATVTFDDEPADATLAVNISATLFVTITNGSSYESVYLTELKLNGSDIEAASSTAHFNLINNGGSFNGSAAFPACAQPDDDANAVEIVADGSYECAFTVELLTDGSGVNNIFSVFHTPDGAGLSIKVIDGEGGAAVEKSVNATVQLVPNL